MTKKIINVKVNLSEAEVVSKKGKLSYASRVDVVPHKTGIPEEWLNTYIEMIESCINEHPTINQNTISQGEFLDTIRRYYIDGIIMRT